jgi:hypothetical protein
MKTAFAARNILIAAIIVPLVATTGVVGSTGISVAQQAGTPGGNNGGTSGRDAPDGTTALDKLSLCIAAPCNPPRKRRQPPRRESVSIAPDCSCEIRKVRVGGQFVQIKECYQVVANSVRYCAPLAQ